MARPIHQSAAPEGLDGAARARDHRRAHVLLYSAGRTGRVDSPAGFARGTRRPLVAFAGGVYFLHAVKRVQGMRVITPQWKHSLVKSKRLAPVPHRVHNGEERLVARSRERDKNTK